MINIYLFSVSFASDLKNYFSRVAVVLLQLAMKAKNKSYCFKCLLKPSMERGDLLARVVIERLRTKSRFFLVIAA
jgi:hypothetical protein